MHPTTRLSLFLLVLIALPALAQDIREEPTAADLFPSSTLIYVEIDSGKPFVDLLTGPMMRRIMATPQAQQAWGTPQALELKAAVAQLEVRLGTDWATALRTLTDGGLHLAFDPATQGAGLLIRTSDALMRDRLIEALIELARQDAIHKGLPDPIQPVELAGFHGYKTAKGGAIAFGPWILVTNSESMVRWMIEAYSKPGGASLASDTTFRQARSQRRDGTTGWAFARLDMMRALGIGRGAFTRDHSNPALELLAGGMIDALSRAPYATGEINVTDAGLSLEWSVPFDRSRVTPQREYFFPPAGEGSAPKPLNPPGTILSFSLYRDLAALWRAAPDLFNQNVATRLAQADSTLSNFFSGRSFSADVLTRIAPRIQLLIVRQDFNEASAPIPLVQLPAAALVFTTRNPQETRDFLRLSFQTGISLINIGASMNGTPTLMVNSETHDGVTLASAEYLAMAGPAMAESAPIYLNFSPSLALVGNHAVLATTRPLAERLAIMIEDQQGNETVAENTLLEINLTAAVQLLRDNRDQLVAQNMIEEGVDRPAAESNIDFALQLLSNLRSLDARLIQRGDALSFQLDLRLETGEPAP